MYKEAYFRVGLNIVECDHFLIAVLFNSIDGNLCRWAMLCVGDLFRSVHVVDSYLKKAQVEGVGFECRIVWLLKSTESLFLACSPVHELVALMLEELPEVQHHNFLIELPVLYHISHIPHHHIKET